MMRRLLALSAGAVAATALAASPLLAQGAGTTPPAQTARAVQDGCVRRGEDARVCACGVGIAYSKLEPRAFALIPQIDPLIDEPDQGKQLTGLLTLASRSGLSVQQLQSAYDTIRANRATVNQICKPLAPARAIATSRKK
ncbi:MAG: hypothetical protein IV086_03335 [Hyphomonadaceae bacterium]|nr:MAG: hypothetical protein FD160_664 [Caulobacteraceae bacterium]MBT9444714.1 hypothetical protein [Hyphomonadaceae bacterium]TPW05861.1 MAG: hypothetical protein FD124_1975 [Alphaproteobacteria bacterium]